MNVVFLDIDGVLNGHDWDEGAQSNRIQYRCVCQLNRIIRATDCKFVLSSAWRYMLLDRGRKFRPAMTTTGFEYLMRTHGACGFRLLGTTAADADFGWTLENNLPVRGLQIQAWLEQNSEKHGVERYVAIDDDDLDITPLGIPLVQTNPKWGLSMRKAAEAIRFLSLPPSPRGEP